MIREGRIDDVTTPNTYFDGVRRSIGPSDEARFETVGFVVSSPPDSTHPPCSPIVRHNHAARLTIGHVRHASVSAAFLDGKTMIITSFYVTPFHRDH